MYHERKKVLQDELKQLHRTEQQNKGYQELLQSHGEGSLQTNVGTASSSGGRAGVSCTRCGQSGHIKTNRDCPLYSAASPEYESDGNDDVVRTTEDPLKLKIKKTAVGDTTKCTVNLSILQEGHRKHQAQQKKRKLQEAREQAELYKRPSAITKKRRLRVPLGHLASHFEVVYYKILKTPESAYFRNPVDRTNCPDYYSLVKDPMDLKTILSKIESFEYTSTKEFIRDLDQIVRNSKIYNGDQSSSGITKCAAKLLSMAKDLLVEEATECEIVNLEKLLRQHGNLPVSLTRRSGAR